MKKIILLFGLFPCCMYAQTAVKLYANFNTTTDNYYYGGGMPLQHKLNGVMPLASLWSVAVNKQLKKNKFVEVELGTFSANEKIYQNLPVIANDSVYRISLHANTIHAACRIEYGQMVLGNNQPKTFSLLLAHSIQAYYSSQQTTPVSTNFYGSGITKYLLKYAVTPHINYTVSKHIGFDINVPIQLLHIGRISNTFTNPSLPIAQRTNSIFDLEAFNKFNLLSLRCGIIYHI